MNEDRNRRRLLLQRAERIVGFPPLRRRTVGKTRGKPSVYAAIVGVGDDVQFAQKRGRQQFLIGHPEAAVGEIAM